MVVILTIDTLVVIKINTLVVNIAIAIITTKVYRNEGISLYVLTMHFAQA